MDLKEKQQGISGMFEPALRTIVDQSIATFGPVSFLDYLKSNNLPRVGATADAISIDSYERLHSSAKSHSAMIMRLGQTHGVTGTQFALVKVVEGKLDDFFLIDDSIFSSVGFNYIPEVNLDQLKVFSLLPSLTEKSYVNLAFSSGLISYALGVDKVKPIYPPAGCSSTFTFKFKPHTLLNNEEFLHNRGQVEIDAMFIEKRNDVDVLFVVEAKSDSSHRSLAKHKLLYPVLGISEKIPSNMPIVPVYMKVKTSSLGIHYHIVECSVPDPRLAVVAYNELTVKKYTHLILNLKQII
ncbi:hypothetical protein PM3016_6699 [Paenibacillus mucilaginosus 3016]|uniref:DUF6997 domain-containing protein n=1 Tax=Paenibacillus mucilaginosus 3016 TaxID=1116391 RepID=H6NNI6_9BACL|nr:hypothetical protein [Paenibacillus mucilaginosus]AFC33307.1 hypothetical protein PM3016_6699 [Paenibacillus mucilaginosus 3016]WFA21724.1 hypothetical protein ERY13_33260 [Paenibacillus mucilaginosus]